MYTLCLKTINTIIYISNNNCIYKSYFLLLNYINSINEIYINIENRKLEEMN